MKKPIKLHIPEYYDEKIIDKNRLILRKTKALLAEDSNAAQYIVSIENTKDYRCNIPEIGKYQAKATKNFHEDRENNWELPIKINDCKVYTYYWDDDKFHFRIYWIVISENYMLQIVGIFEPKFSAFYKSHFMAYFQVAEIDTDFDFSSENNPNQLFDFKQAKIFVEELQEIIDTEKQKTEKAKFLEENLKISNSNFYTILEAELKEKETASIENFICADWNMYYDLYNPENFSDPDSTIEWEDNSDVYDYYETPYTDNSKIIIECTEKVCDLGALKNLVTNKDIAEQKLLSFFEHYTFGNGGANANATHYQWAKIEIERLHNTTYTNQEFLKRNLCLRYIFFTNNSKELRLHFYCSWDTEHGIEVIINNKFECRTML